MLKIQLYVGVVVLLLLKRERFIQLLRCERQLYRNTVDEPRDVIVYFREKMREFGGAYWTHVMEKHYDEMFLRMGMCWRIGEWRKHASRATAAMRAMIPAESPAPFWGAGSPA